MFVPLLVLDGLLAAALVALLIRQARLRRAAASVPARLAEVEVQAERALASLRWAEGTGDAGSETAEARPDPAAERRPRRRVRRVGPPATPDRP
ncbi:hypothetical protein [Rubrivirga sp.]|uniref:hypothetical protein n=1 Tax=Rubrivirga sp. TaxID=1885344 RepID=UPI003B520147